MEHLIAHEIAMFRSLSVALQLIYVFNFVAGVVLPLVHLKQALFLRKTEVHPSLATVDLRSMAWTSFLRSAPFIYSFTVIWSLPLFIAVGLDLLGRLWVLFETYDARERARVHEAYVEFVKSEELEFETA